jgi:hypothetical protein
MYGLHGKDGNSHFTKLMAENDDDSDFDGILDDIDIEEPDLASKLGIEPEDVHGASRIVLQRQFFEAIVRAAYVKYLNSTEYPTLAEKLDYMFKTKLTPNACKTKAKSVEEEVRITHSYNFIYRNHTKLLRKS